MDIFLCCPATRLALAAGAILAHFAGDKRNLGDLRCPDKVQAYVEIFVLSQKQISPSYRIGSNNGKITSG